MLKEFLESALDGEMSPHLDETERSQGNKRNGRGRKRVKTMAGEIEIETPQDRHSSFTPEILKKRETILADNLYCKIISLYGMGISLPDISSLSLAYYFRILVVASDVAYFREHMEDKGMGVLFR